MLPRGVRKFLSRYAKDFAWITINLQMLTLVLDRQTKKDGVLSGDRGAFIRTVFESGIIPSVLRGPLADFKAVREELSIREQNLRNLRDNLGPETSWVRVFSSLGSDHAFMEKFKRGQGKNKPKEVSNLKNS